MADIPFVKEIEFEYGVMEEVAPGIRRVIANNPGPFTYPGTGTYVIGQGEVAVIDPGPNMPDHVEAILKGLDGETVTHILITHTHFDHSPAAAPLKAATGAATYGYGPHAGNRHGAKAEEGGDFDFLPDHRVKHGDIVEGAGWSVEALHTPGHISNHICYAYQEQKALFTGDHVMGWSTSVITPPDGSMTDYMAALRLLLDRDDQVYWPTHGAPITDPKPFVEAYIAHREAREAQIMECLRTGTHYIPAMVKIMYTDVPEILHSAAGRSVQAHLIHMEETGRVTSDSTGPGGDTRYTTT